MEQQKEKVNEIYKVKLVVGDWSKDGHNQSDDFYVESNLSAKEIETAYKKGTKKVKFDLCKNVASNYEDNILPKKFLDTLVSLGFNLNPEDLDEIPEGISLFPEVFSDIYLFIVKLGNPNFEYKWTECSDEIHIGGYGLYSS